MTSRLPDIHPALSLRCTLSGKGVNAHVTAEGDTMWPFRGQDVSGAELNGFQTAMLERGLCVVTAFLATPLNLYREWACKE